jgi:sugar (pentulose or hexulose) kinase
MSSTSVIQENAAVYEKYYNVYRELYPALKPQFSAIGELVS